eukprot:gene949-1844_t
MSKGQALVVEVEKTKKRIRNELSLLEKQIYELESHYLEDTREFGNILTGWDQYLSHERVKGKKAIYNDERLFSLSSVTSPASRREEIKKWLPAVNHQMNKEEVANSIGSSSKKSKKKKTNIETTDDTTTLQEVDECPYFCNSLRALSA